MDFSIVNGFTNTTPNVETVTKQSERVSDFQSTRLSTTASSDTETVNADTWFQRKINDSVKGGMHAASPDTTFIDKAIKEANKKLTGLNKELHYSVHKKTKDIMIKIYNKDTKEVEREIPPEKRLDAIAKVWEMMGILVDDKG